MARLFIPIPILGTEVRVAHCLTEHSFPLSGHVWRNFFIPVFRREKNNIKKKIQKSWKYNMIKLI